METSLDFTDAWASLRSLIKADADVVDVPQIARRVTLANRSTKQVWLKRTRSTSAPSVTEGFRLDAETIGIWYITLENVNLDMTFMRAVATSATGEVDISIEI